MARGDPPAREIHFTDWKSIPRPANPTVLLQGGRGVFVVTEYWQEIQRRELPRDPCTPTDLIKHRSAAQASATQIWKTNNFSPIFFLHAKSLRSLIRLEPIYLKNLVTDHNTNWKSDIYKKSKQLCHIIIFVPEWTWTGLSSVCDFKSDVRSFDICQRCLSSEQPETKWQRHCQTLFWWKPTKLNCPRA